MSRVPTRRAVGLDSYPKEGLVLTLIALAALATVHVPGAQDSSRIGLTRSLTLQRSLAIDPDTFDRAVHAGLTYSDKPPGMSLLALPAYELERAVGRAPPPREWRRDGDLGLWLLRVSTGGALFLLGALLVGRAAETLALGTGALVAVTFALGTLANPLAATLFGHVAAGTALFAAFLLVWRGAAYGRGVVMLAGFCLGGAVLIEYQAALAGALIGCYALATGGRRRLARLLIGATPPLALLATYNWTAFGAPWHFSYSYVANVFAEEQSRGFFGIGLPRLSSLAAVLVGNRGLLVVSPVLLLAAAGLVMLGRRGFRLEATLCASIALVFLAVNASYFLPFGGDSPGPRFFCPALPFLALGLAPALERWYRPALLLVGASIVSATVDAVTWALRDDDIWRWPGIRRVDIAETLWSLCGTRRSVGAVLVAATAATAFVVATSQLAEARRHERR